MQLDDKVITNKQTNKLEALIRLPISKGYRWFHTQCFALSWLFIVCINPAGMDGCWLKTQTLSFPHRPRGNLTGCSSYLCVATCSVLNCIMHRETSDKAASQLLGMASKGGGQSNAVWWADAGRRLDVLVFLHAGRSLLGLTDTSLPHSPSFSSVCLTVFLVSVCLPFPLNTSLHLSLWVPGWHWNKHGVSHERQPTEISQIF